MHIKLIRHGESKANTGQLNPTKVKDAGIPLSPVGVQQATEAGALIGKEFINDALIYCSPYQRTRQTLENLLKGAEVERDKIKVYEDPRIREIDMGYGDAKNQFSLRQLHGWFYYRYDGGESPADCYDRTSAFLESMVRQVERSHKNEILIVCHGMTLRCFVARFLHLTVEEFEDIYNPENCDIVTITFKEKIDEPNFFNGRWAVEGLKLRNYEEESP